MPLIFLTFVYFLNLFFREHCQLLYYIIYSCSPHFCLTVYFFVIPNPMVAESSSQDTKCDKQEGNNYSWERKDQPSVSTQKQTCKSQVKYWILTDVFFYLSVWIWKEKNNMKFYFPLFTRHYTERAGRADFGKNSYLLLTSVNFPRSQSKWCVPTDDSRNCRERKKKIPLP